MPIEIKELVIRATVDESPGRDQDVDTKGTGDEIKGCCADELEMIIQMIKDKKER